MGTLRRLSCWSPRFMPMYSGGGTTVLQLIIETITGQSFPEAMKDLVLEPAGMTSSTFVQPRTTLVNNGDVACGHEMELTPVPGGCHLYPENAAAGLWSSAEEMGLFLKSFWESLSGVDGALLKKETAWRMLERQGLMGGIRLGWMVEEINGRLMYMHGGANEGYTLYAEGIADSGESLVLLSSASADSDDTHYILWVIREAIGDAQPIEAEKPCLLEINFEKGEEEAEGIKMSIHYIWMRPMVLVKKGAIVEE
ncbi:beta-lactamase/transpeptidase-like protein [Chytridium lagenaria]|nr:beta-lactamase/transpeptidase-like protein [Chytridium lagenaria]